MAAMERSVEHGVEGTHAEGPSRTCLAILREIAESGAAWLGSTGEAGFSESKDNGTWEGLGGLLEKLATEDPSECANLGKVWLSARDGGDPWVRRCAKDAGCVALAMADWRESANRGEPWRPDWEAITIGGYEGDDEGGTRWEETTQLTQATPMDPKDAEVWNGVHEVFEIVREKFEVGVPVESAVMASASEWGLWKSSHYHDASTAVAAVWARYELLSLGQVAKDAPNRRGSGPRV